MYTGETCTHSGTHQIWDPAANSGAGDFVPTNEFNNALEVTEDTLTQNIDGLDPGKLIIKQKIYIFSLMGFL